MHNGITFGAGIGVGYRRPRYCYSGAMPRYRTQTIALQVVTYLRTFCAGPSDRVIIGTGPNHRTIFGTVPSISARTVHTIVLYLVRGLDIEFDRAVRWYWFECLEFQDQDHVTMNRQGYVTIQVYQMYLRIVAPKLKEILFSVRCMIGYLKRHG